MIVQEGTHPCQIPLLNWTACYQTIQQAAHRCVLRVHMNDSVVLVTMVVIVQVCECAAFLH